MIVSSLTMSTQMNKSVQNYFGKGMDTKNFSGKCSGAQHKVSKEVVLMFNFCMVL